MSAILHQQTLVLSKSWFPIGITSVKEALSMMFSGRAKAYCSETYIPYTFGAWAELGVDAGQPCIRTEKLKIRVPEIIILTVYSKSVAKKVPFSRQNVYKRDKYTCQFCGRQLGKSECSLDHVIPRSKGGKSSWENCVLSCFACNQKKGDSSLKECGMTLLKEPVAPKWELLVPPSPGRMKQSWLQFIKVDQEQLQEK